MHMAYPYLAVAKLMRQPLYSLSRNTRDVSFSRFIVSLNNQIFLVIFCLKS